MKKLLFVYNPHSGKGEIGNSLSDIVCVFTAAGYDVTVHPTGAQSDGRDYIAAHAAEYDIAVSSGGDGMLHELFDGIIASGSGVTCGYIPAGTINDFASSLKIPKVPKAAAEVIVAGNTASVDAGVFNGSIFSYVAAFGLFTKVSYATDQNMKNMLGAAAYFIEILKSMDLKHFREASVRAKISANGEEYQDEFIFGMAGNTYSVGGLANLVPEGASMDDGLLDCMFIRTPKSLAELDAIRNAIMTRRYDIPNLICVKTDRVEMFTEREIEWTLDGEFGGSTDHAVIGVKNRAVTITVPGSDDKSQP